MTKIKWKCTNNKISDSRHWDSSLIYLKHTSDKRWLITDDCIVAMNAIRFILKNPSFLKMLEKYEKYYFKKFARKFIK